MRKLISTLCFVIITSMAFSQARELIGRDTLTKRPGIIIHDTAKTLNLDTTLSLINQSAYQSTIGINPNIRYWLNNTSFPWKIHLNSYVAHGKVGIGTDTPTTKLHITGTIAANTTNDSTGILMGTLGTATTGNQMYSGRFIREGRGFKSTGPSGSKFARFSDYVIPIQGTTNILSDWRYDAAIEGLNSDAWVNMGGMKPVLSGGAIVGGGWYLNQANGTMNIGITTGQIDYTGAHTFSIRNVNGSGNMDIMGGNMRLVPSAGKGVCIVVTTAASADASSILDIRSTTMGVLLTRMTTTQRDAISSPATGLMTYNTSTNTMDTWDGTRFTSGAKILAGSATLDFGNAAAQTSEELTITVTGAADGDVVVVSPLNAAYNANSNYTARVSATNTVSVAFNNFSAGAIDPASAVFKVLVFKN